MPTTIYSKDEIDAIIESIRAELKTELDHRIKTTLETLAPTLRTPHKNVS